MQVSTETQTERVERYTFNRQDLADMIGKHLERKVKWGDFDLNCHSDDEILTVTLVMTEYDKEGSYEEGYLDAKIGSTQRTNPSAAYLRGWNYFQALQAKK